MLAHPLTNHRDDDDPATRRRPLNQRRGVVLILILAMLSLLAVIGVTFATFSGQTQVSQRYFAEAAKEPEPERLIDFGIEQLINDTDNPASALRGHSLKRDMYGNDATTNGTLQVMPPQLPPPFGNLSGRAPTITALAAAPGGTLLVNTNIPYRPQGVPGLATADFTRWSLRLDPQATGAIPPVLAAQSFEVLSDANVGGFHQLLISAPDTLSSLAQPIVGATFVLDGRYLRAFNGTGINSTPALGYGAYANALWSRPILANQYPVLAFNGSPLDLTEFSMDEDYDAVDLDNWFLALQSADGQVIVPSFHRPAVLQQNDWIDTTFPARAKFLRPRAIDHPAAGQATFPDLVPDAATGRITYDVDNDGDGVTDSVWLDLGFPALKDASGKLYKPLFAFMVEGLNGRLPLNTAGNLQGRDFTGLPSTDHTSHLGTSPSEINPKYAFSGSALTAPGKLQLQRLLQGYVQSNQPVQGRWGEAELLVRANANFPATPSLWPRPGRTTTLAGSDDLYAAVDFVPEDNPAAAIPTFPEQFDFLDGAAGELLPSERFQRFVTPYDRVGTGRLMAWDDHNPALNLFDPALLLPRFAHGFDNRGRVGYYQYFRPPGIPSNTLPTFLTPVTQNGQNIYHGFESYRNPLGRLEGGSTPLDIPRLREFWGAMPWNRNFGRVVPTFTTDSTVLGTSSIVAFLPDGSPNPAAYGLYPGKGTGGIDPDSGVLGRDIADQMYLYGPTPHDAPFTSSDLEWLYRLQDVDGTSLTSRLAGLLPGEFVPGGAGGGLPTAAGALTARRLFSVEAWDLNTYAWANDNPGGGLWGATATTGPVQPNMTQSLFYHNSTYSGGLNQVPGSTFAMTGAGSPLQRPGNPSHPALSDITQLNPAVGTRILAPEPIAHRGRRINLNFPLPASKNPMEITRLKWISETYAMLKVVLPPKAVDTPLELAQLGQYVVNIIDFRDPDDTVTIWTNPDVRLTAPTTGAVGAATDQPYPVYTGDALGVQPLVHYGMEHPPVAINEVLAYNFRRKVGTAAVQEPRFYMELVNLLTRDKGLNTSDQTPPTTPSVAGTASNLTLAGWDIVITREETGKTAAARPNPITGQLPFPFRAPTGATPEPPGTYTYDPLTTTPPLGVYTKVVPLYKKGAGSPEGAMVGPDDTTVVDVNGLDDNGNPNFFTIGYPTPTDPSGLPIERRLGGTGPPTGMPDPRAVLRQPIDPASPATVPTAVGAAGEILDPAPATNQYYWVYLRRPAMSTWNEAVPEQRPGGALNPMVVIDSMRFPYIVSDSTVNTSVNPPVATEPTQRMWSTQRLQPLRGAQAVPSNATTATFFPEWAYGFSDQTERGDDTGTIFGLFDPARGANTLPPPGSTPNNNTTRNISHSLGTTNEPVDETWRPLVFNDRDFQSVAELLLVPGVPPALFTKHFTEAMAVTAPAPLDVPPITSYPPNAPTLSSPPTYPFLVDNFYYSPEGTITADNAVTNPVVPGTGPVVGGPTGAGWHKILEFFEVPAPNLGAIGPVADGENRDWARQDLRPGQINLNLIIDEEVFFGVLDDPRLNFKSGLLLDPTVNPTDPSPPVVVTQVNAAGLPDKWYPIANRGFHLDPTSGLHPSAANGGIKAAFADFLRLRHGNPVVGPSHFLSFGGVAAEMPYHSLSYPDIRYTLLRPADPMDPSNGFRPAPAGPPVQPPAIPPRRLFQVPDYNFLSSSTPPLPNPATFDWLTGTPPYPLTRLSDAFVNLFDRSILNAMPGPPGPAPGPGPRFFLGGDPDIDLAATPVPRITQPDRREHPLYRTEMLQKLMNLTTVRTHQFGVWVTVGLFEVVKPGNPQLAASNPALAIDQLGPEVGKAQGINKRYRSFFVIDRTRATGFNPREPGDFRDLILYRRRIE